MKYFRSIFLLGLEALTIRLFRFFLWTSFAIYLGQVAGDLPAKENKLTFIERCAKPKVASLLSQIRQREDTTEEVDEHAISVDVSYRNAVDSNVFFHPRARRSKRRNIEDTVIQKSSLELAALASQPVPTSSYIGTTSFGDSGAKQPKRSFEVPHNARKPSVNSLFGFGGHNSVKAISIFEVLGEKGERVQFLLHPASLELDESVRKTLEFQRAQPVEKFRSFSPSLSYIAVQLGYNMVHRFGTCWQKLPKLFTSENLRDTANGNAYRELFLPFTYQLLLKKPTPIQWCNIESIFFKFMIYWKIQLLYNTRVLANIDYDKIESQLLESLGKAFMWISELLCRMCDKEFLTMIRKTRNELYASKTHDGEGFRGFKRHGPFARIFYHIIQDDHLDSRVSGELGHEMYSELLKRWQNDCQAGYPFYTPTKTEKGFEFNQSRHPRTKEDSENAGSWWFTTSLEILHQSEQFVETHKFSSMFGDKLTALKHGNEKYYIMPKTMKPAALGFLSLASKQPKSKKNYMKMIERIINLIPNIPFRKPSHQKRSLDLFNFLMKYKEKNLNSQYLPDQVKTFFHLDEMFPPNEPFWKEFDQRLRCQDFFMEARRVYRSDYLLSEL